MRTLRVWATNLFVFGGQYRCLVATQVKGDAARAFGVSMHYLDTYGSQTGNATEIALATAKPGVVLAHINDVSADPTKGEWREVTNRGRA